MLVHRAAQDQPDLASSPLGLRPARLFTSPIRPDSSPVSQRLSSPVHPRILLSPGFSGLTMTDSPSLPRLLAPNFIPSHLRNDRSRVKSRLYCTNDGDRSGRVSGSGRLSHPVLAGAANVNPFTPVSGRLRSQREEAYSQSDSTDHGEGDNSGVNIQSVRRVRVSDINVTRYQVNVIYSLFT